MPCHPDRVRRNYHKIVIKEAENFQDNNLDIIIKISKSDIASCMTKLEVIHNVNRFIRKGILESKLPD